MTGQIFLKASNATSDPAMTPTGAQSSANGTKSQRSRHVDGFALSGVSDLPDPLTHAYRQDLADTALAGRVIASHYAEPFLRHLIGAAQLLKRPAPDSEMLASLAAGEEMRVLDISRGWAWGYGPNGLVGYVPAEAVAA
jgi:hypothetical protein